MEEASKFTVNLHETHMKAWRIDQTSFDVHYVVDEHHKTQLGDFWRVLQMRPSPTYGKASKDFEYVPNSVYTYTRVKQTL
jgi:hypothetical protein